MKRGRAGGLPTDYQWQLYDLNRDFSQTTDLAAREPKRVAALQSLWMEEAKRNNVLPLDDRRGIARATSGGLSVTPRGYTYWGPNISIAQSKAPPLNFRSFTIEADVTIPEAGASGALIATRAAHLVRRRPKPFELLNTQPGLVPIHAPEIKEPESHPSRHGASAPEYGLNDLSNRTPAMLGVCQNLARYLANAD